MDCCIEEIRDTLGETDFYILPSSIHEVIIIPAIQNNDEEIQQFQEMVKEINATMLDEEEFLSDTVYKYDAKEQKIICAA